MMGRLLVASLRRRFRQLGLIVAAVAIAAATASALAAFAERSGRRLAADLAAFGPNLIVRPQPAGPPRIAAAEVARVRQVPGVLLAAGVVELDAWPGAIGAALPVVASTPELLALHRGWELEGRWPERGEVLAGAGLAADRAAVERATGRRVVGRLATGGARDGALFVPLADAAALASGGVDRIEARAEPGRLEAVARAVEARVAGVEARPLVRVSASEARLTRRVALLLGAIGAVTFALALLSVATATTALLGERRMEMGLLLALGYSSRRLALLVGGELVAAALLAAVVGEVAGELAARGLVRRVLGAAAAGVTWTGGAAAAAAAVAVVGAALAVALRRLGRLDAARVLRGE